MGSSTKAHPRPKPERSESHTLLLTTPLSQQVAGHAGIHTTEDESLLLKPALPREIAFYQFVRGVNDTSMGLHPLKEWIPNFFGVLSLEGRLADPTADIEPGAVSAIIPTSEGKSIASSLKNSFKNSLSGSSQTLVLQNLLHGYSKPCILDVKLGTVLYDDEASEEKKARMIKKAVRTTTLQTGVRLTGFQVYSNHSPDPVVYGNDYGCNLKPEQLPEGIKNFFPCSADASDIEAIPKSSGSRSTGLPQGLLLTLLTSLHVTLIDLRKDLSGAHVRIVGGSVLIIYEGDWERAIVAAGRGGGPRDLKEEIANEEDEDQIEIEVDENGQIIVDSIPNGVGGSSSVAAEWESPPRLFTVSLIDFGHARVVPEEGPDQGLLTGMDTLIRLVDHRRQEVAVLNLGPSKGVRTCAC